MKLVHAYIRPHKLDDVSLALHGVEGLSGMTAWNVRGWGHEKQVAEREHHEERVSDFKESVRLEVLCHDGVAPRVVDAIRDAAHTGLLGDGQIVLSPVESAWRIRIREEGAIPE